MTLSGAVAAVTMAINVVSAAARPPPPHIIAIVADDAGWNDFGFTRNILVEESELIGPQAKTPHLDALARGGVVLSNHYSYRYCSPSRAAFLTGRLPFHAHEANPGLATAGCTNLNYTMLPAKLAAAGYYSVMAGKWHQGLQSLACVPKLRGFNSSFGYLGGAEDHVDQTAAVCGSALCRDNSSGGGCVDLWRDEAPAHGENGTYNDYAFTREVVGAIEAHAAQRRNTPLFVYAAFQNVHGPYEVPQKYRDLFPPDEICPVASTAHDCCGWTERGAHVPFVNVSNSSNITSVVCDSASREGICKCPSTAMPFQPARLHCPPGAQCSRNYLLAMLAALDDSVANVTAALKRTGLYNNSVILFVSDNGGAVADGSQKDPNGQSGSMNNFPLRGGKGGYFEGGVRTAAFVHSPRADLIPPPARGSVAPGLVSIADWWPTFGRLAGLDNWDRDPGFMPPRPELPLPRPWGCAEHRPCTFDIDGVDQWAFLMGANSTAPRTELMLGRMAGGALLHHGNPVAVSSKQRDGDPGAAVPLYKYVVGAQYPDWWYGPHSPNCTDATGAHLEQANCAGGCLFELRADATEHVNLRDSPAHAGTFAAMKARFEQLASSVADGSEPTLLAGSDESTGEIVPSSPLCGRMQDTYGGFFGPWAVPLSTPMPMPH